MGTRPAPGRWPVPITADLEQGTAAARLPGKVPWTVAAAAAGAAWWGWRHQSSRAVKLWAPGGGTSHRAGPLQVRVLGSGGPVVLLLHGMVAAGNSSAPPTTPSLKAPRSSFPTCSASAPPWPRPG